MEIHHKDNTPGSEIFSGDDVISRNDTGTWNQKSAGFFGRYPRVFPAIKWPQKNLSAIIGHAMNHQ